jgi:hypothetical protein
VSAQTKTSAAKIDLHRIEPQQNLRLGQDGQQAACTCESHTDSNESGGNGEYQAFGE